MPKEYKGYNIKPSDNPDHKFMVGADNPTADLSDIHYEYFDTMGECMDYVDQETEGIFI